MEATTCKLGICDVCSGPTGNPQWSICVPCSVEWMDEDQYRTHMFAQHHPEAIRVETEGLDEPYDYEAMFEAWLDESILNRLEHLRNLNQESFGSAVSQLWHHQISAFIAIDRVLGYDEPPCPF